MLSNIRQQKVYIIILLVIIGLFITIFGNALRQDEDHMSVFAGVLRLSLHPESVIVINIDTYLIRTGNFSPIITLLQNQGWIYREQLGSTLFFVKGQETITAQIHQYSRYFQVINIIDNKS